MEKAQAQFKEYERKDVKVRSCSSTDLPTQLPRLTRSVRAGARGPQAPQGAAHSAADHCYQSSEEGQGALRLAAAGQLSALAKLSRLCRSVRLQPRRPLRPCLSCKPAAKNWPSSWHRRSRCACCAGQATSSPHAVTCDAAHPSQLVDQMMEGCRGEAELHTRALQVQKCQPAVAEH